MHFEAIEKAKTETLAIVKSGTPGVHLCGDDYSQMDMFVAELAKEFGYEVLEWNYGYGLVDFATKHKRNNEETAFDDFLDSVRNPEFGKRKIALLKNTRFVLEGEANVKNIARLQQTLLCIKNNRQKTVLVYCDEQQFIPDQLSSLVHFVELKPPSTKELQVIAGEFIEKENIGFSRAGELAKTCTGMNEDTFRRILNQAALEKETFADKVEGIAKRTKKQAVEKSRLLELVETDTGKDDIGGLAHLKWWLGEKEKAIFDAVDADRYGVKPAKGIMLVGMPGCGKSLSAKAIANIYKIPLLRLDMGTLMGKYLGQSEERLRRALRLAEDASPCVLWVDEIEKAFAGVGGDETGVSQRLFGYILTWLNDKTATVFVVGTANDIAVLPSEFMRRGRFDEIFSVDFPQEHERKEIFKIHIRKAVKRLEGFDWDEFERKIEAGLDDLAKETKGYAGSDIASLVNDAMEAAWNSMKNSGTPMVEILNTQLVNFLKTKQKYIKPLEQVLEEKIKKSRKKYGEYKLTSASFDESSYDIGTQPTASPESRKGFAADARCPAKYLERLAGDNDRDVLLALIENPSCPFEAMARLSKHSLEEVKTAALEKYIRSEAGIIEIAKTGTKERKLELPSLSSVPDAALEALVEDADSDVAVGVLQYRFLPEKVLSRLVERAGSDEALREKIKGHPNCPPEIREKLERRAENCIFSRKAGTGNLVCNRKSDLCRNVCEYHRLKGEKACCLNCRNFLAHNYDGNTYLCKWTNRYFVSTVVEGFIDCDSFLKK